MSHIENGKVNWLRQISKLKFYGYNVFYKKAYVTFLKTGCNYQNVITSGMYSRVANVVAHHDKLLTQ